MSDWRDRAEISADVVYFQYIDSFKAKNFSEVYVWDLDKTYLDTSWGSLSELIKTALEKAFQKRNIPGTRTLVLALRASQTHNSEKPFPVYYITASPPQMEHKITEKLQIDGIKPFGAFFKDNLKNLRPGRIWRLTKQVGFKLQALLQLRTRLSDDVRQILWGDDSESDAVIYNLYSDICARRLHEKQLRKILKYFMVIGEQMDSIIKLQSQIPVHDPVEKIYINLADDTDPEYYGKFGRRTLPTYNSFQTALDLTQDRRLKPDQLVRVGRDLMDNYAFTKDELERALDDLIRRQVLGDSFIHEILPRLMEEKLLSADFKPSIQPTRILSRVGARVFEMEGVFEPWVQDRIDYLHDYR